MTVKVDRFDDLVHAIRKTVDRDRMQAISVRAVRDQRDTAGRNLRLFSPYKTIATHKTTGHRHTTIAEGWLPQPAQRTADGATAAIVNESEHVGWQRTGTPRHDIQMRGPYMLKFWLGDPLKWGIRSEKLRLRGPGFFTFRVVDHKGFKPWGGRDFAEVAADAARPEMVLDFRYGAKEIAFRPLRELFRE